MTTGLRQLKKDADFLHGLGVMDYSLLIGVHHTEYDMEEQRSLSVSRGSNTSINDDRRLQVNKVVGKFIVFCSSFLQWYIEMYEFMYVSILKHLIFLRRSRILLHGDHRFLAEV